MSTNHTHPWGVRRPGPGARLPAVVDVLESIGSDMFAHIALDHDELAEARPAAELGPTPRTCRCPPRSFARLGGGGRIREAQPGTLWVHARKLHLFDASTGERL
jgi:multiple sugar transport system ATP-binding protein